MIPNSDIGFGELGFTTIHEIPRIVFCKAECRIVIKEKNDEEPHRPQRRRKNRQFFQKNVKKMQILEQKITAGQKKFLVPSLAEYFSELIPKSNERLHNF